MAALSVALNDQFLVSVATNGFDLVDVSVSGDVMGPKHAILRVSAGSYPEGQASTYLIWEDERHLMPGDMVSVHFRVDGTTSRPGKTIEELYVNEPELRPAEPFATPEQVVADLKKKPKCFPFLAFEFIAADGTRSQIETAPGEHGFGFTVLWDKFRPETVRAALHSYTLDSLITKQNGRYHANSRLAHGQGVSLVIRGAPNGRQAAT
jgi:hypothetical protein